MCFKGFKKKPLKFHKCLHPWAAATACSPASGVECSVGEAAGPTLKLLVQKSKWIYTFDYTRSQILSVYNPDKDSDCLNPRL